MSQKKESATEADNAKHLNTLTSLYSTNNDNITSTESEGGPFDERTETAAAQRDRLELDRGGFLKARGGQSVQHGLRQQQGAEVDAL